MIPEFKVGDVLIPYTTLHKWDNGIRHLQFRVAEINYTKGIYILSVENGTLPDGKSHTWILINVAGEYLKLCKNAKERVVFT